MLDRLMRLNASGSMLCYQSTIEICENDAMPTFQYTPNIQMITKKFWDEKEKDWVDKKFVRIWNTTSEVRKGYLDVSWFVKHYGSPIYGHNWWTAFDSIVMEERIYTHWALSH